MRAAANDREFADKMGIDQKTAQEFVAADKKKRKKVQLKKVKGAMSERTRARHGRASQTVTKGGVKYPRKHKKKGRGG